MVLEALAGFLKDISIAWREATPELRNRLLKQLVEETWINGDRVIGIRPRVEFEPFFALRYSFDGVSKGQKESPADN